MPLSRVCGWLLGVDLGAQRRISAGLAGWYRDGCSASPCFLMANAFPLYTMKLVLSFQPGSHEWTPPDAFQMRASGWERFLPALSPLDP